MVSAVHTAEPSDSPIRHSYFRAVYSTTVHDRPIEFTFAPHRFAAASALPEIAPTWAIITARNPMSRRLDETTNQRRDAALMAEIHRRALDSHPSANRAPDGGWLEPGRIILDCTREDALDLARVFAQRAIIWSERAHVGLLETQSESWVVRPAIRS
jgi:hypothetical protein